ncbi:MAG TPA: GAF domain-containing protein [Actinomycetota bacterium]
MTSEAERVEHLIDDITAEVIEAATLDEALDAITVALRERYQLWRSSIWTFEPPDAARLIAAWSIGDTAFEPGVVVRFSLTDDVEFLATSVMAGKPMMMRTSERDLGLLTDMLKREGIASAVIVPVGRNRKEPIGLLALASSAPDVFKAGDVRFVAALARTLSHPLTSLVESALPRSA